jgi:hypothetical protein
VTKQKRPKAKLVLSPEAREYCIEVLIHNGREELVSSLEGIGVACYDEEDDRELAEAAADSVEAGDIEFDFSFVASKQYPHHLQRLHMDINEVWVEAPKGE